MHALFRALQKARNRLRAWQLNFGRINRDAGHPGASDFLDPFVSRCRFCETDQVRHRTLGKVPLTFAGELLQQDYSLVQCGDCEVIYLDPEPPASDLQRLYVGSTQFSGVEYSGGPEAERIAKSYSRRLRYLNLLPESLESVLEIGAGPAWICRAAKDRLPRVETIAQDISDECAERCPWVDTYFVGALSDLKPAHSIQLAAMTHVIEHLPRPGEVFGELAEHMAPGGKVYITAPFRPALWRPKHGFEPWLSYSYLHVPAHISYLSEKWISTMAAKSGFDVIHWDASLDGYQVFEAILRKQQ